ncbi:MAG: GIY-YIG nuclease family protein [Pikeienuella sp.]|uniref:GIY-YIG nuclease family protein n=1 Tax=Pikeienuella sp. TaxID=2831957 RepID=UPI00391D9EDE
MLASRPGGALNTGCANDLRRRVEQHRAGAVEAHTSKYGIHTLVWFEVHETLNEALQRERQIKRWRRAWKGTLIAEHNPHWRDLCDQVPL